MYNTVCSNYIWNYHSTLARFRYNLDYLTPPLVVSFSSDISSCCCLSVTRYWTKSFVEHSAGYHVTQQNLSKSLFVCQQTIQSLFRYLSKCFICGGKYRERSIS